MMSKLVYRISVFVLAAGAGFAQSTIPPGSSAYQRHDWLGGGADGAI